MGKSEGGGGEPHSTRAPLLPLVSQQSCPNGFSPLPLLLQPPSPFVVPSRSPSLPLFRSRRLRCVMYIYTTVLECALCCSYAAEKGSRSCLARRLLPPLCVRKLDEMGPGNDFSLSSHSLQDDRTYCEFLPGLKSRNPMATLFIL